MDLLWVCDVQPKLLGGLSRQELLRNSVLHLLEKLNPQTCQVVITEQIPAKLGHTDDHVLQALKPFTTFVSGKHEFSGWRSLKERIEELGQVRNLIFVGAETHICVMQTVQDLILDDARTKISRVLLIDECIDSMNDLDRTVALAEMLKACKGFVKLIKLSEITDSFLEEQQLNNSQSISLWLGAIPESISIRVEIPKEESDKPMADLLMQFAEVMEIQPHQTGTNEEGNEIHTFGAWEEKATTRITNSLSSSQDQLLITTSKGFEQKKDGPQHLLTFEALVFDLLRSSEHPKFRACLSLVKRAKEIQSKK